MSLFGKLFGGGDKPSHSTEVVMPDFAIDTEQMFDLAMTDQLASLIVVPREQRDDRWTNMFFSAFWNAAIVVPSSEPLLGPDGFPYLRVELSVEDSYDANALSNIAQACVDAGSGIALFAHPTSTEPAYVLPLGVIDSLLSYRNWRGDPIDIAEQSEGPQTGEVRLDSGSKIATGAPSTVYLTPHAARALHRHLTEQEGMVEPRVMVISSDDMRPSRSLMINKRRSDFASDQDANNFCHLIGWHLPPSRVVTLQPEDWAEDELFPLSSLF